MFENILQSGETIEMQEDCAYCGDGAIAAVKNGHVLLTDKRLIVCEQAGAKFNLVLGLIITFALMVVYFLLTGKIGGALPAAICGAVGFGISAALTPKLSKGKEATVSVEYSIEREKIATAENGNRGVRKMLVVKTQNGVICKIGVQDKEKWQSALLRNC